MEPRLSMITLGVSDLERATKFYRDGLGLPTHGDFEGVTFFALQGAWISLFPVADLVKDAGLEAGEIKSGSSSFTLAHNVKSKEEVDGIIEKARSAGATIIKEPQDAFWGGYHAFFSDMDGYTWEIAWNPDLDLT